MTKHKHPTVYHPPTLHLDYSPFDDEALEGVISATHHEARLGEPAARKRTQFCLNAAAIRLRHTQLFSRRPVPPTLADSLNPLGRR